MFHSYLVAQFKVLWLWPVTTENKNSTDQFNSVTCLSHQKHRMFPFCMQISASLIRLHPWKLLPANFPCKDKFIHVMDFLLYHKCAVVCREVCSVMSYDKFSIDFSRAFHLERVFPSTIFLADVKRLSLRGYFCWQKRFHCSYLWWMTMKWSLNFFNISRYCICEHLLYEEYRFFKSSTRHFNEKALLFNWVNVYFHVFSVQLN